MKTIFLSGIIVALCICMGSLIKQHTIQRHQIEVLKAVIVECEELDDFSDTVAEGDAYADYVELCE